MLKVMHFWDRSRLMQKRPGNFRFVIVLLALGSAAIGGTSASPLQTPCAAVSVEQAAPVLRVGSKRFTESYLLAQILASRALMANSVANSAANSATSVELLAGLGNTAIVYAALCAGSIDLYPEYAGTISREILKQPGPPSMPAMQQQLAALGLGVGIPFGFNDGYALAMRAADADRLGIRTLSELAVHRELRFGLSNEFLGRSDGWRGLAQRYHFSARPIGLDHGLAYQALDGRQIDVTDIYTTDARIGQSGLRVLVDDLAYFPRYDAMVLYRLDVPQRFPSAWKAMLAATATIDEAAMRAMNARAELDGVAFADIAREHLAALNPAGNASSGPAVASRAADGRRDFLDKLLGPDLLPLTRQHLFLVVMAVVAAALIAIPLAIVVAAHSRLSALLLGAAGLVQTIPSLALLAVLIALMGRIGSTPALAALILYALLPILRNSCVGLAGVPAGLRDASRALGMSPGAQLRHIDLPLAMPMIIAGVRTATSISIGTATLAAFIGAGGYGERIVTGLALNDHGLLMAGALPAALLALGSELLFELAAVRRQPPHNHRP
jgi:osmoprotectant transport system permease protein